MFLILDEPIQQSGGMMSLTEAFVRVNRARGMELVSPEDILQAARSMNNRPLPLRLYQFQSGVLVLITTINTEEEIRQDLMNQLESVGSLTPEALSRQMNLSVILARERLLSAESEGLICRDHTIEGLRFYPNKFLVTWVLSSVLYCVVDYILWQPSYYIQLRLCSSNKYCCLSSIQCNYTEVVYFIDKFLLMFAIRLSELWLIEKLQELYL